MNKYVNGQIVKMTEADKEKAKSRINGRTRTGSSENRIKELEAEIKALKEQIVKG